MKKGNVAIPVAALIVLIIVGTYVFFPQAIRVQYDDSVKQFETCQQLQNFVKTNVEKSRGFGFFDVLKAPMATQALTESQAGGAAEEYSTTNIQVEGVDEADIVKNDGKYIYVVSGQKVVIVDVYPAETAAILSELDLNGTPQEMFINGDKLIIFGQRDYRYVSPENPTGGSIIAPYPYYSSQMFIKVYDVSDRSNPVIKRDIYFDGSYFDSRMIGDYAYVILKSYIYPEEIEMPEIEVGGEVKSACRCADIYYFDYPDYSYSITTVLSVNTQNDEEEIKSKNFLLGYSQEMFVSLENIYITYTRGWYEQMPLEEGVEIPSEQTIIHKISVKDGNIEYKTNGKAPGRVLNQFSMDEYNNNFRIATTVGRVARTLEQATSSNNVYVLDVDLNIVGKLEDLAPGEEIYSARFMGDRCYLVTFRKIDPLFVIDLSNPSLPTILGKLKIPGYSDYLHPYDENHLIGIGKESVGAEEGDFAWYQGVKLSLFDVSDVSKPKEVSKYEIGDRGTDSNALHDHKAFLFSKSKGIIVIPITLAEIDEEKYPTGVPPNMYGDFVWQGAYVLNIDLTNGITLRGRVTHLDDEEYFLKSGYYFYTPYSVKRSLYIGNNLYTLSSKMIKMNKLDTLEEINKIELPYEEEYYGYPEPVVR